MLDENKLCEVTKRILVKMVSTTSWGLHPEKGWSRPMIIQYNGEWYALAKPDEPKYFEEQYFDYSEDVKNGDYIPMDMKVGDEDKEWDDETKEHFKSGFTYSNEGCIPSRDYILKNYKIDDDRKK